MNLVASNTTNSSSWEEITRVVLHSSTIFIQIIASLAAIIVVMIVRKRRDLFIVVTLVGFFLSGLIQLIYPYCKAVNDESDYCTLGKIEWFAYFVTIGPFLYNLAHQAFSSQYLKTSMVLPRLLT